MDLLQFLRRFRTGELGAVTVDWVVLTAAISMLGFIVVTTVGDGITTSGDSVGDNIAAKTVANSTFVKN